MPVSKLTSVYDLAGTKHLPQIVNPFRSACSSQPALASEPEDAPFAGCEQRSSPCEQLQSGAVQWRQETGWILPL